jgi:hypothetical protein
VRSKLSTLVGGRGEAFVWHRWPKRPGNTGQMEKPWHGHADRAKYAGKSRSLVSRSKRSAPARSRLCITVSESILDRCDRVTLPRPRDLSVDTSCTSLDPSLRLPPACPSQRPAQGTPAYSILVMRVLFVL